MKHLLDTHRQIPHNRGSESFRHSGNGGGVCDDTLCTLFDYLFMAEGFDPFAANDPATFPWTTHPGNNLPVPQFEDVLFRVGDSSSSESERWKMTVTGLGPDDFRSLGLASPDFGKMAEKVFRLRKWNTYEITLTHLGTSPKHIRLFGVPDYDWEASVGGEDERSFCRYSMLRNHWLADNSGPLLTPLRYGGVINLTSGLKTTLVPVDIDDNQPASGTDDISCTVPPGTAGRQAEHWIMAPAGPVPEDPSWGNTMRWNTPLPSAPRLDITTIVASPNPNHVLLDETRPAIDWRGASSVTIEDTPGYLIGPGFGSVALPVKVKNMKKRYIKIAVHPVRSMASHPPIPLPDKAAFVSEFNRVYGWQLNLWLRDTDLIYKPETMLPYGYPGQDGTTWFYGSTPWNGLITSHQDAGADINLILVGSCSLLTGSDNGTPGHNLGLTQLPNDIFPNTCVLNAIPVGYPPLPDQLLSWHAAHEIGHIIIGPGHPDQDSGPAPLQHTDRTMRLMHSLRTAVDARRLVKKEWDKAEVWLSTRPNGDN